MEHPLIGDISNLTMEELQQRVNDLTRKLGFAIRTNPHMANQLRMALETFQNQLRAKQEEFYRKQSAGAPDYSDKIDISR